MAMDMDQLRRIFYEECRENLEVLERELLALDPGATDLESINTIFRAAHSIKGGAATFNLDDISHFTHVMETLLDEAREGKRQLDSHTIDVLLRGGDCILAMLEAYENEAEYDESERDAVTAALNAIMDSDGAADFSSSALSTQPISSDHGSQEAMAADIEEWLITFVPHPDMLFSGNDPVRILRELHALPGGAEISCDPTQLPRFAQLDPEKLYLRWDIRVDGHVPRDEIEAIFEWVEDECDLTITPIHCGEASDVDTEPVEVEPSATVPQSPEKPASSSQPKSAANKANKPAAKSEASVSSIRVEIDKVDNLINLVGELVITQSMLAELSSDFSPERLEQLQSGLEQLMLNTKELQESVLDIRMLPISFAFNRFPRLIRDLSSQLGKRVELVIEGESTELDKTVLERIADPLVHLVRNAVDHGLETPEVRAEKGKPETGKVHLNAYHQGGSIVIEVSDDGAGLHKERIWRKALDKGLISDDLPLSELTDAHVFNLLFAPGFSTAEQVSDVSGRGVGMDVVRRNIEQLGGNIDVHSAPEQGSTFKISLPLTLAILDGQLVKVEGQVYVVPLISIIESLQIDSRQIKTASGVQLYRLREENIPILRLKEEFELGSSGDDLDKQLLCLVEAGDKKVGLLLDELLGQQQVVIKSLESNYARVPGISGATILGDGSVSLILDIQGLITQFLARVSDASGHIAAA
ncbi:MULTISPECIES: chemotaxis protein CheA [unclassified Salinivibrio]|uniref:chemotaxis protein CheA n=1 Tax=unclassified Salinivibrio TaxID=2636825 RepID=UPI00128DDFC7|nr:MULTISPECIES: chemotaxis protein CheA [unclassified Salinivibrio]MPS32302.1 chemotaxis protein CheA [Salinivibrio sp. VYel7]MPX93695.1 chemotaxis protein CheA [Salinivibrio sp. VYel9]MPX96526.1 chemotaxis protein CheA [Salinivibrio sp. VYel6]MPX99822.1 chemotaxis protein CheA [Salinivibrio sp. VYel4]MPY02964.1 chemotaxis protein CheA [Salinivibrio sp. VYel5]